MKEKKGIDKLVLDPKVRFNLAEESSLLKWFPVIGKLDIPVPKTVIVKVPNSPEIIKDAAQRMGYPLFMKTDLIAGKHDWDNTCFVEKAEYLGDNIVNLVSELEVTDMESGSPFNALVFREYIELDSKFKAFLGMPVARERRYFIDEGQIVCHHPYWIESAISFWHNTKEPQNWKDLLKDINTEGKAEIDTLTRYAQMVADVFQNDWAVDFAHGKDGVWYLIDMQRSQISWHPDCEFKIKDKEKIK